MFNQNKYTSWYYSLISKYSIPGKSPGYETHHIVPKCMNGNNCRHNLAIVPARVHFVLHKLLVKMVDDTKIRSKLLWAVWRMMNPQNSFHQRTYRRNSHQYEIVRNFVRNNLISNNPMHDPNVVKQRTGVIRPQQIQVCIYRNQLYWSNPENKVKKMHADLQKAIKTGLIYQLTNIRTGIVIHCYMKKTVKTLCGSTDTQIRWSLEKQKPTKSGFLVQRVKVDSVSKYNLQNSGELTLP